MNAIKLEMPKNHFRFQLETVDIKKTNRQLAFEKKKICELGIQIGFFQVTFPLNVYCLDAL